MFGSRPENDDSSLAATDSDDAARLEDTAMDPEDFDFSLDPIPHPREGKERCLSPATIGDQLPLNFDDGRGKERPLSPTTIGNQLPLNFDGNRGGSPPPSPPFGSLLQPQKINDDDGGSPSYTCLLQPRVLSGMVGCIEDEEEGGGDGERAKKRGAVAASSPPPCIADQATLVRGLMEDKLLNRLVPGQSRFLVALSWMRSWHEYIGWNSFDWGLPVPPTTTDPPGPITNEDILEADGLTLQEDQDLYVECVTGTMWDLLSGWYGGNPIERLVIMDNGHPMVELYQMNLKLARKGGKSVDVVLSKSCTVGDMRREGIARLQIGPPEECEGLRMFQMSTGTFKLRPLEDDLKTLSLYFSLNEGLVQFELPGDVDSRDDEDSILSSRWRPNFYSSSRRHAAPGAVGLSNLGNTCFMNAAIQCLGHIPQVVSYFGEKGGRQPFFEDLNIDNPLGTKGELAKAFGDLVRVMWEGKESCIFPRDFRDVLCDHAQQFLGYEQHDSQEFLAYLLDGIHEDVNRVREKPFVEKVEASSGEDDEEAAQRAWKAHLRRNDSFVVDTMHGQYKSVVTCPVEGCGKTSTTFDPAMYLSVPLPVTAEKSVELTLATADGCRPRRYVVWVSHTAKVKDLKRALSKACGTREDLLAVADVWQLKLTAVFEDDHLVSTIRLDDMFVFELPKWPQPPLPPPTSSIGRPACLGDSAGCGGGSGGGGGGGIFGGESELDFAVDGWVQKLTPYLKRTYRQKELRSGNDAEGRSRLLKDAKDYLKRFPCLSELSKLTLRQKEPQWQDEVGFELDRRLKEASDERRAYSCPFTELLSLEDVLGFVEAVNALKALVMHEQRPVKVQIVHHRSTQPDTSSRLKYYSQTTMFCFPLLVSYLPYSTTVKQFRDMIGMALRRLVRPGDATKKDGGSGLDTDLEGSGVTSVDESDPAEKGSCASGAGEERDPDTVIQLLRSGELELLSEEPQEGCEGNILGGGDDTDEDLISDWIEESPLHLTKLKLRWSDDAAQEAYDSSDLHEVEDDPSVAMCRDRIPEALSVSQCLEHFLEREQLDESEMWYCSSCKEHRRAYKELSLWRLPPVLIMHLKRFSYDTHGGWAASREKIDSFVTFPVRGLDMRRLERVSQTRSGDEGLQNLGGVPDEAGAAPSEPASTGAGGEDCPMDDWVVVSPQQQSALQEAGSTGGKGFEDGTALEGREERAAASSHSGEERAAGSSDSGESEEPDGAMYDLWGVVNHYGGINGGHYTAFALNKEDSRWYDFSDDRVSTVESESDLVTAAAYVLFYQRRGAGADESGDSDGATTSPKSSEDEPSVGGDSDRFDGMGV